MLQGTYQVVVKNVDKTLLFDGSLTIKQLGEAYSLDWSGNLVSPNRRPAQFTGIGLLQGRDTLAATFQETAEGDVRQKIEQANAEFGLCVCQRGREGRGGVVHPNGRALPSQRRNCSGPGRHPGILASGDRVRDDTSNALDG